MKFQKKKEKEKNVYMPWNYLAFVALPFLILRYVKFVSPLHPVYAEFHLSAGRIL